MQSHNVDLAAPKLPEWNVTEWRQTRSLVCICICICTYMYVCICLYSVYGFLSDLNRHFYWSLPPPPDKPEPHRLFFDLVLTWQKEKVGGKVGRGLAGLGEEGLGTLGWGISSSGQTQPPTPNCYRLPLGAAFVIVTKAISSISKTVILLFFFVLLFTILLPPIKEPII